MGGRDSGGGKHSGGGGGFGRASGILYVTLENSATPKRRK